MLKQTTRKNITDCGQNFLLSVLRGKEKRPLDREWSIGGRTEILYRKLFCGNSEAFQGSRWFVSWITGKLAMAPFWCRQKKYFIAFPTHFSAHTRQEPTVSIWIYCCLSYASCLFFLCHVCGFAQRILVASQITWSYFVLYTHISVPFFARKIQTPSQRSYEPVSVHQEAVFSRVRFAVFSCVRFAVFSCVRCAAFSCVRFAVFSCVRFAAFSCVRFAAFSCVRFAVFSCVRFAVFQLCSICRVHPCSICSVQLCSICSVQLCSICSVQLCSMCSVQLCSICSVQLCSICSVQLCSICSVQLCSICSVSAVFNLQCSPVFDLQCSAVFDLQCSAVFNLQCSAVFDLQCSAVFDLQRSAVFDLQRSAVFDLRAPLTNWAEMSPIQGWSLLPAGRTHKLNTLKVICVPDIHVEPWPAKGMSSPISKRNNTTYVQSGPEAQPWIRQKYLWLKNQCGRRERQMRVALFTMSRFLCSMFGMSARSDVLSEIAIFCLGTQLGTEQFPWLSHTTQKIEIKIIRTQLKVWKPCPSLQDVWQWCSSHFFAEI